VNPVLLLLAYAGPLLFGFSLYIWLCKEPEPVEALVVAWAVGWVAICAICIVGDQLLRIALDSVFFSIVTTSLLIPASGLLVIFRRRLTVLKSRLRIPPDLRSQGPIAALALLTCFTILMFYMALITPPDSTDALVYHMQLPKRAFETGHLPATPGLGWIELSTAWSGLVETQQLWIYLGGGEVNELFVRPIMPIFSTLLGLIVFRDVRRHFGLLAAGLAVPLLFSLNEFTSLTTVLWDEVPVALYSYLAVRQYLEVSPGTRPKIVSAFFGGAAGLVKYDGLLLLLAIVAVSTIVVFRQNRGDSRRGVFRGARESAREMLLILGIGILASSPLLLRNLLIFGNPIYPFIWGGVNTEQLPYFTADYSWNDYVRFRIYEAIVIFGSLVTACIAIGVFRWRNWTKPEKCLLAILILYLPGYLYQSLAGSHIRYLAPVLPIGAVLAGRNFSWWLVESESRDRIRGAGIVGLLIGLVVALFALADVKPVYLLQYIVTFAAVGAVSIIAVALRTFKRTGRGRGRAAVAVVIVGIVLLPGFLAVAAQKYPPRETAWDFSLLPQDPGRFLEQRLGDDWRMWQWINQNVPVNSTILTFEARLFYLDREVIFGADHILLPTYSMRLVDAVAYIRALGVTFVLDSPWSHVPGINRIFLARSVIFQNLENQTYLALFHAEGDVKLYAFTGP